MIRRAAALAVAGLALLATAGCGAHHHTASAPPAPATGTKSLNGRTDHLDAELRAAVLAPSWPAKAQGLDGVAPVPSGSGLAACTTAGTARNAVQLSVTVALPDAKKLTADAPALVSALTAHGWKFGAFAPGSGGRIAKATHGNESLTLTEGTAQLFLLGFTPCAPGTPVKQNATPTLLKLRIG